jgi:hypothetical protein
MISFRLERYKRKDDYLFNFRCPICGDSAKKNKARGYLYKVKNDMFYKCHNCQAGKTFGGLLEIVDSLLHKEYVLERYSEGIAGNRANKTPEFQFEFKEPKARPKTLIDEMMDRLDGLPEEHEAVQYALKRMIPKEQFNRLYYLDDIRKASTLNSKYTKSLTTEQPRLVLPFVDEQGKLTGMAMRGMRGETLRYIMLKIDEDASTIFGLENMDRSKNVKVVEGPIDSLFIPNAIACAGSAFNRITELNLTDYTIVFDNQPRNSEIVRLVNKYINEGANVVIWPETVEAKDINDMVLQGLTPGEINSIIEKNTYTGLRAQMKLTIWRKC